jgi:hypothetical protein
MPDIAKFRMVFIEKSRGVSVAFCLDGAEKNA